MPPWKEESLSDITSSERSYTPPDSSSTTINLSSVSKSDNKKPSLPKLNSNRQKELVKVWNRLGKDAWKEVIDGEHHKFGPMVFDDCLHKENWGIPEHGYLNSMLEGRKYIESQLGKKTTIDMWLEAHRICTQHFQSRRRTGTDGHNIGGKIRTKEREPVGGLFGDKGLVSNAAKKEISQRIPRIARLQHVKFKRKAAAGKKAGKKAAAVVEGSRSRSSSRFSLSASTLTASSSGGEGYRLVFLKMKRKRRIAVFNYYRDKFYRAMRKAKSQDDKIAAIAEFHIIVQQLHIARDGTQRTSMLFINKHLTEYGFHPIIQMKPHKADISTVKEMSALVKEGFKLWEKALKEYLKKGASDSGKGKKKSSGKKSSSKASKTKAATKDKKKSRTPPPKPKSSSSRTSSSRSKSRSGKSRSGKSKSASS